MKKIFRYLSLILTCLMVFSCLAILSGCNSTEDVKIDETVADTSSNTYGDGTDEAVPAGTELISESETETVTAFREVHPEIAKKNYGEEFFLHILPDVNPTSCYWVEESDNDMLTEAVFERQRKIQDYLGVEIIGTRTGNYSQYIEPFKTAVKNKDGSVDTLISHVHTGINSLISENYLTDFNDMPGVMIDADHWNQTFMENISINDHMYLGYSDLNILYTYVVAYNKEMLDKYDDEMDETVYEMVDNYRWTLDAMISIANLAYIDISNNGKTVDDQYGVVGLHWVPLCGFLHSSNINLIEIGDDGQYQICVYNETNKSKTSDLVDKIKNLSTSNAAWFWENGSSETKSFTNGDVLMSLSASISLSSYTDYELSFGVLPYPMYDEAQKSVGYRSLQWGGYICVPSYTRNIDMVGDTVELLTYFSDNVQDVYYQKLLGKQVADSPDDRRMLELIWDSIVSDFGQTYHNVFDKGGVLYLIPEVTKPSATKNLASFMASIEKTATKSLRAFISKTKN